MWFFMSISLNLLPIFNLNYQYITSFDPNKARIFESSFILGGQFDPPSYFKKN